MSVKRDSPLVNGEEPVPLFRPSGVSSKGGDTDHSVHRRANLVAHHRQKFALGAVGRLSRLLRLVQESCPWPSPCVAATSPR